MADVTLSPVIRMNNMEFDKPVLKSVPCGHGVVAESTYWRIPVLSGLAVLVRYEYRIATDNNPPTLDSNKVIRVRDQNTQNIYWIVVASNQDVAIYNTKCAICCGNNSDMPVPAFVVPVIENKTCKDSNGKYNHFAYTEELQSSSYKYNIAASVNGAFLAPTAPYAGFDTLADMKTWLNANWADGGNHVWDVVGFKVTLVSATAATASIVITTPKIYESNAPGALGGGQTTYTANITADAVVLGAVTGATLTALATALNASTAHAALGVYSVVAGVIRLATTTVQAATIVVSKS